MFLSLTVVLTIITVVNFTIHAIGGYLLVCLYKNGRRTVQVVYLINISICEFLINFLEFTRRLLHTRLETYMLIQVLVNYQWIIYSSVSLVTYLTMCYLPIDKFLGIWLNMKYPIYMCKSKAWRILWCTWILGGLFCVTLMLIYNLTEINCQDIVQIYVFPVLDFTFVTISIIAYCFIFNEYRTQPRIFQSKSVVVHAQSMYKAFRASKFHIAVIITTTFLIFVIIPDLVILFLRIFDMKASETIHATCAISYGVSDFCDAITYIFMQKQVRSLARRKLGFGVRKISRPYTKPRSSDAYLCDRDDSVATIRLSNMREMERKCPVVSPTHLEISL